MLIDDLKNAGLDEAEAKMYLAALELGETNISRLAQKSGIKRTTTYLVVDSLREKGLISSIKKGKKMRLYAEDPRKIDDIILEKKRAIDRIMPELLSFANLLDRKPKIRYFEGKDAYKEVFKDILKYPNSEIRAWFNEKFVEYDFFPNYFIPKRKERKIWARAIFPDNQNTREVVKKDQEHLRQSKLVSSEKFKMDIEINIYGKNQVGIIAYDEEIAVIIESQKIYEAQKSIFEVMWEML
jgi:sugar-specific transcriptional regulator TrmB